MTPPKEIEDYGYEPEAELVNSGDRLVNQQLSSFKGRKQVRVTQELLKRVLERQAGV